MKKQIRLTTIILVITIILITLTLTSCSQQTLNGEYQATIKSVSVDKVTASANGLTKTIYINEENMTLGAIGKYKFLEIEAGDIVSIKVSEGRIADVNMVKYFNQ
jgi:uncharacterized protein YrrD